MKKKLNLHEIRQIEKQLFELTNDALSAELDKLKSDFKAWMLETFELTLLQKAQLISLPKDFCDSFSESLHQVWKKRIQVQFISTVHLQDYPADTATDIREISLNRQSESSQCIGENTPIIKDSLQVIISFY